MTLQQMIARQDANKAVLKSIGPKTAQRKKSVPAKQQVKDAKAEQAKALLEALHDGKRTIPSDWERGYNLAMSIVAQMLEDK